MNLLKVSRFKARFYLKIRQFSGCHICQISPEVCRLGPTSDRTKFPGYWYPQRDESRRAFVSIPTVQGFPKGDFLKNIALINMEKDGFHVIDTFYSLVSFPHL